LRGGVLQAQFAQAVTTVVKRRTSREPRADVGHAEFVDEEVRELKRFGRQRLVPVTGAERRLATARLRFLIIHRVAELLQHTHDAHPDMWIELIHET
jgi:hypothetical protein